MVMCRSIPLIITPKIMEFSQLESKELFKQVTNICIKHITYTEVFSVSEINKQNTTYQVAAKFKLPLFSFLQSNTRTTPPISCLH